MTDNFETAKAMMDGAEAFGPILDGADGMKADLENRGWSPTMAEQVAGVWLCNMINMIFTNHQAQEEGK